MSVVLGESAGWGIGYGIGTACVVFIFLTGFFLGRASKDAGG